jgi:hypothetical protein
MNPERPFSPAAERNLGPIRERLLALLAPQGRLLEIASGTGQHAVGISAALPGWRWQPSDVNPLALPGIAARAADAGATHVQTPLQLDVTTPVWPVEGPGHTPFDAIYCANLLHIAPWACCAGLMQGSARCLAASGQLITYGPYLEDGVPTAPGNLAFDASLRASDPAWGLRSVHEVARVAQAAGLVLTQRHAMPANNLLLVWRREP